MLLRDDWGRRASRTEVAARTDDSVPGRTGRPWCRVVAHVLSVAAGLRASLGEMTRESTVEGGRIGCLAYQLLDITDQLLGR